MNNIKNTMIPSLSRLGMGVVILGAGLGLVSCSTTAPDETTQSSAPSSSPSATATVEQSSPAASSSPEASSTEAAARTLNLKVTGAKDSALVKALVITSAHKAQDGQMTSHALPFEKKVELAKGEEITKVLVIGKYADGATGDIACSISIDGKEVKSNSSTGHKPAECLLVDNVK